MHYNCIMEIIEVENIKTYLQQGILSGEFQPFYVINTTVVTARQGTVGEIINSWSPEGNYSTTKTVFRTTNNEIDWVLTFQNGERIVLDDATFRANYDETDKLEQYASKQAEKIVVPVNQLIQFRNKHGNIYRVMAGHYVVADTNDDFYELTPLALQQNYKVLSKPYRHETDNLIFNN